MNDAELAHYSAALDEIYRLRAALAYETEVLSAHLDYKTFPKSRRGYAEAQVVRMRAAAQGDQASHLDISGFVMRAASKEAGVGSLTREQWENR